MRDFSLCGIFGNEKGDLSPISALTNLESLQLAGVPAEALAGAPNQKRKVIRHVGQV